MPSPTVLAVTLDRDRPEPLTSQLAHALRSMAADGRVASGDRLPSTRALAVELGVSRAVVEQAYDQLLAEGWLTARHGSGTFVSPLDADRPRPGRGPGRGPAPGRPPRDPGDDLVHLDTGTPWIDPRHRAAWRRAWRDVSGATPPRGYDDPRGMPELREALAERLARTRGLDVDPDEVWLTHGTTDGLRQLVAGLPPGPVAVEDPGYRAAVEVLRVGQRRVVDLPVTTPLDLPDDVVAAYVTPAHQHPLGETMSGPTRLRLLEDARRVGAVVVEDDYDSEFRYDVAPVPALASLDRDRVAYLGTAAKSVAPSLRLGWMVLPRHLQPEVLATRRLTHDVASWPVQRAFWSLLRDGYVDQVVRSARRVYADRAPRVAAALTPYAERRGPAAGMYSTWLMPGDRARAARDSALRAGFDVPLLSAYCRTARLEGLVVGFGGVTDDELDRALAALVHGARGARTG